MLRQPLTAVFLFVGLAIAKRHTFSSERRQTTISGQCPTTGVHVIAVSGSGDVPVDQYGLLGNLSTSIVNAIPGSTTVQVPYDKASTNQLIATTAGSVNFTAYVDEFHASCPCSKVVIIGYSSGAIIAMNSLCGAYAPWTTPASGFNSSYTEFIAAVVVYGDETRTASASYNIGTCTGNGRVPRSETNAACPLFADRIESYCNVEDPQCCLGTVDASHLLYDLEYDAVSTPWIVQQVAAFGDICPSSNSTNSSTSSNSTGSSTSDPVALATATSTTASSSSTNPSTTVTTTTTDTPSSASDLAQASSITTSSMQAGSTPAHTKSIASSAPLLVALALVLGF